MGPLSLQSCHLGSQPDRHWHSAKAGGHPWEKRSQEDFYSGLAVRCAGGHRKDKPGFPADLPAETVQPSPGHPSAILLWEPAEALPSPWFLSGQQSCRLARQKQHLQEPGKGTAGTRCSAWLPSGRRGQGWRCASSKSGTGVPFLQQTEGSVTVSSCWQLSGARDVPGKLQCAAGQGTAAMWPHPDTRGWLWETEPRGPSQPPTRTSLLGPHQAASPHKAFARQQDQKASNPLMAPFGVERLPWLPHH